MSGNRCTFFVKPSDKRFPRISRSKLTLKCYYPGKLTGGETCKIKVNGRQMDDLVFTDNTMYYEIPAAPYQRFTLEFSCNFYVKGAREHRGEENLAMVVKVVDQ